MKLSNWIALAALTFIPMALSKGADPTLVGTASFLELGRELYIGALYSTKDDTNSTDYLTQGQSRMVYHVTHDRISKRKMLEHLLLWSAAGSQAQSKEDTTNFNAFSESFNKTLAQGDEMIFSIGEEGVFKASINGEVFFTTKDRSFYQFLMAGWVGEKPPSKSFKQDMLAGIAESQHRARYQRFLGFKVNEEAPKGARYTILKQRLDKAKGANQRKNEMSFHSATTSSNDVNMIKEAQLLGATKIDQPITTSNQNSSQKMSSAPQSVNKGAAKVETQQAKMGENANSAIAATNKLAANKTPVKEVPNQHKIAPVPEKTKNPVNKDESKRADKLSSTGTPASTLENSSHLILFSKDRGEIAASPILNCNFPPLAIECGGKSSNRVVQEPQLTTQKIANAKSNNTRNNNGYSKRVLNKVKGNLSSTLNTEGTVHMTVRLDNLGNVINVLDSDASNNKVLSSAAMRAILKSSPLPRPPEYVQPTDWNGTPRYILLLPVSFSPANT